MGYNLCIGEAYLEGSKEDCYLRVWAMPEAHDEAPTFPNDELTGNSNSRSPGYSAWTDFCRDVGLYGLFYGLNGKRIPYMEPDPTFHRGSPLLAEHPGAAVINEQDVLVIKQALDRHVARHGDLTPGFRDWHERDEDAPPNAMECAQRARLLWLHYWCDWAVKNCKLPVLVNS